MAKKGSGWIGFAGVMLIIAGFFDIISGLWALDHKDTAGDQILYEGNLETWGWIYLIVGIVILVAGFGVFGARSGRAGSASSPRCSGSSWSSSGCSRRPGVRSSTSSSRRS